MFLYHKTKEDCFSFDRIFLFVIKKEKKMYSFDEIVKMLAAYKEEYGDCLVPQSYTTEDGVNLGILVSSIRSCNRKISIEEERVLDSLGFAWQVRVPTRSFEDVLKMLIEYKKVYGDCKVPAKYITEDGILLGSIVGNIRRGNRKISPEQKAILDDMGFIWNTKNALSFDEFVKLLSEYKRKYGHCLVPESYITEEGVKLGKVLASIRCGNRKTSAEEKAILDSLGFVWQLNEKAITFEQIIKLLREYKEKHGDCLVPRWYTTEDGINFGRVVSSIRAGKRMISAEERERLDNLGFVWELKKSLPFDEVVSLIIKYKEEHGDCLVPTKYVTEDGILLGRIVGGIRYGNRQISVEEKAILDDIGFVWNVGSGKKR